MSDPARVERRRQFCGRCGQFMFEYYRSPDGHFGWVAGIGPGDPGLSREIRCSACGARYRLLERIAATGGPVVRAGSDFARRHDVEERE